MKKWSFKKLLRDAIVLLILLTVVMNVTSYLNAPQLDSKQLPAFQASTLEKKIFISQQTEKPLMIHFWATWCPICKLENSSISKLASKFNIITVAVNSGSDEKIENFLQKHNLHFPVINDADGHIASLFKVKVFPTTLIYDKKKKLLFEDTGYSSYFGLYLRMLYANH
jgi:thiol-disulfide isomerase/thioredoxin